MNLTENAEFHGRMKYIGIKQQHFIRELDEDGTVMLKCVDTTNSLVDTSTKPLSAPLFGNHFKQL
jgi:hypothetical protein